MAEAMFKGTKGRIVYRRWGPAGAPQRIAQIVHGYGERGDYPDFPLVLVGHSMRGLLPALYAERWPDKVGRHEVLTETNRDEVIGDLATWIPRVA